MRVYIVAGGDGRPGVWVRVGGGSCGHLGDGCPGLITPHHRFFRPLAEAGGQVYLAATVFNTPPQPTRLCGSWTTAGLLSSRLPRPLTWSGTFGRRLHRSRPPPPSSTPVTGRRLNGLSILCAFPISGSRTGAVLPSRPSFFAPLTFPHLHRATRGHGRRLFKRWGRSAHARRRVCTAARLGAAAADVVAKGWTERQDLCTPSSAPTRRGRKPPLSRRRHRAPVDVVCLPPAPARRRRGVSQRSY